MKKNILIGKHRNSSPQNEHLKEECICTTFATPLATLSKQTQQQPLTAQEFNQRSVSTWNPAANERREFWADYLNSTSSCDSIGRLDCQFLRQRKL